MIGAVLFPIAMSNLRFGDRRGNCQIRPEPVNWQRKSIREVWTDGRAADELGANSPEGASVAELTTEIVSAYVAHNSLATSDLARLIGVVAAELRAVGREPDPTSAKAEPAVPIRRSITVIVSPA